jgi:hypothetical protein
MHVPKSVLAAGAAYLIVSGCNRIEYLPPAQNSSGTTLTIVKRSLSASSQGFRFLGIIPFAFPDVADTERRILAQAGVTLYDPRFVLVNKVKQTSTVYFFVASVSSMTLTADVAEIERMDPSED